MIDVPAERVRACNDGVVNGAGKYVLYWMTASRRRHWNFGLQRAVQWAVELRKPLLVVEGLNCRYRWANARFHAAILQGMLNNVRDFEKSEAVYYPFVERFASHGKGMIKTLAERSAVVVTDDFPAFDIPAWTSSVAKACPVVLEKVDSNGILPMRATDRIFTTAHSFRRFLQTELRTHLETFPMPDPLENLELPRLRLPQYLRQRWPAATVKELASTESLVSSIPVDQSVPRVDHFIGGHDAAQQRLRKFVRHHLAQYEELRNQPRADVTSGLSTYLHFGHISAHEVFRTVTSSVRWSPENLAQTTSGKREGWWNAGPNVEAFLDQLITWREIGFNMCVHSSDYDRYSSLPAWARQTLSNHAGDSRPTIYSHTQFERAATHDKLWNAAQTQLVEEGCIHNYLRMLWGKKILEWSPSPQDALEIMIQLNNKFALDGRDPNSYSGIFWILGRYDRPWAPERPIFGNIRYMSSESTARKLRVQEYINRYTWEDSRCK